MKYKKSCQRARFQEHYELNNPLKKCLGKKSLFMLCHRTIHRLSRDEWNGTSNLRKKIVKFTYEKILGR